MNPDSAAFKVSGMRQGKYIFQVFPPDVPVGPVGNLHLAVRPLRRVFSLQVFEVFLFVSPDDGFFRNLPDHGEAFVRPRAADAVIPGKQEMRDSPAFSIFQHGLQGRAVSMDIGNNGVFHAPSGCVFLFFIGILPALGTVEPAAVPPLGFPAFRLFPPGFGIRADRKHFIHDHFHASGLCLVQV